MFILKDIENISLNLDNKLSIIGGYYLNSAEYFLKDVDKLNTQLSLGLIYRQFLDTILNYNYNLYPSFFTYTYNSKIIIQGVTYDSVVTEKTLNKSGDKIRLSVRTNYTIGSTPYVQNTYIFKDYYSETSIINPDITSLITNINNFINTITI